MRLTAKSVSVWLRERARAGIVRTHSNVQEDVMRNVVVMAAALVTTSALATLPPASPAAQAQAAEAKAKAAWTDKVAAYQLCRSQDRVAETYRSEAKGSGNPAPAPATTAPCVDPGPYATPEQQKPLEASGAHSPSGTAISPPSRKEPAAELMGTQKKQ